MDIDELKDSIYTSLKEIGLTDFESSVYVASLALGPSPISVLAKHVHVSRPNIYKLIQGLEKHGLAKFSEKGKYARNFMVEPPTVVVEKLRQKKEILARMDHTLVSSLPDMLALYHQGEGDTKIRILKGKEQYLKVFNQSLDETKGEIQFFGSADTFINFISWEHELEWIKKRVKRNIFIKVLLLPGDVPEVLSKKDKEEMRETRVMEDMPTFPASFQLFANKVIIWQPKAPLAILIEDEFIVEMLRAVFNNFWERAGQIG